MKLHPVDVAKEFRQFNFFKSFADDLLLQISTMTEQISFKKGDLILQEGQSNKSLYFLRKGIAEIMLAGEVVAILQLPGDVMGDMSVVTERPVSTSIRANTDVECFVINSENFAHVNAKDRDHFQVILYKLYSTILADRLAKTNEKARLFEIANRELHQAQVALDKIGDSKVLLVVSDKKQLVMSKMAVGATGVAMDVASESTNGWDFYKKDTYDVIICDDGHIDLLKRIHEDKYAGKLVLMTSKEVQENLPLLRSMMYIDNLITRDPDDRAFTMRMILTALTKLLTDELFGLDKYLTWGVDVHSQPVQASHQRQVIRDEMCRYFKSIGVRNTIVERCNTVTEEILMNAIYDAPTDPHGNSLFNHLSRQTEVVLETHLQAKIQYGCDGILLGISVSDPFGGLTKKTVVEYLESCYAGKAGSLNEGKGGAGRGLHQIIENADLTIFNVKKGSQTEVICFFFLEAHKREARPSFHYFFAE